MSKKLNYKAEYKDSSKHITISLSLFIYKEDGLNFVYSPALDLNGYGNTTEEAKKSFETTLEEFVVYTSRKKTLVSELERLGWKIKKNNKKNKQFITPDIEKLLKDNEEFSDIINNKEFKKINTNIELPEAALAY